MATRELGASETFSERMRAARTTAGISQVELVERLERLGFTDESGRSRLQRPAIIELEKGTRRVSVDEWLAISAALGVAPLYLVTPFEDERMIGAREADEEIFESTASLKVAERLVLAPKDARRWIRGKAIYYDAPLDYWPQYYCVQVPPAYRHRLRKLAAYIRAHEERLGRWVEAWELSAEETVEHEMAIPGLTTPENRKGYPAPLWTWWMFKEEDENDDQA